MTFKLYAALSSLDISFAHFLIGSLKRFYSNILFFRRPSLGYPESNDSDESNKEESDEIGSELGSIVMCGTSLGNLLRRV